MRSETGQFPIQIDAVGRGLSLTTPVRPQPLSDRDSAILLAIDQYRYLDSDHIADLFHLSQRKAQLRLKNLLWRGVIYRWSREQRQGSLLTPAVYVLSTSGARHVASLRGQDPRPVTERARLGLIIGPGPHLHMLTEIKVTLQDRARVRWVLFERSIFGRPAPSPN